MSDICVVAWIGDGDRLIYHGQSSWLEKKSISFEMSPENSICASFSNDAVSLCWACQDINCLDGETWFIYRWYWSAPKEYYSIWSQYVVYQWFLILKYLVGRNISILFTWSAAIKQFNYFHFPKVVIRITAWSKEYGLFLTLHVCGARLLWQIFK